MPKKASSLHELFYFALTGFPLIIALIGLLWLLTSLLWLIPGLRTYGWSTAPGVVTSSSVGSVQWDRHTEFLPQIEYEFTAAGNKHLGSRVWISEDSSHRGWADGIAKRYPVGSTVSVRFDPDNPSESVLEAGPTKGTVVTATVGASMATIALTVFFHRRRIAAKLANVGASDTEAEAPTSSSGGA